MFVCFALCILDCQVTFLMQIMLIRASLRHDTLTVVVKHQVALEVLAACVSPEQVWQQ